MGTAVRVGLGLAYALACASQGLLLWQEARERERRAADQRRAEELHHWVLAYPDDPARQAARRAAREQANAAIRAGHRRERKAACAARCRPLLDLHRPQQPDRLCIERCLDAPVGRRP